MKQHIKKSVHKVTTKVTAVEPIVFAFGSAALAVLLVVGAISADIYHFIN